MTSVDPYRPPAPSPRGWVVRQYDPLIAVPAAEVSATLLQPEVWAGRHAYTTAPAAAAVATAIAPSLLVDIGLSVPIVTAAADAPVPELYVGPDKQYVEVSAAAASADIPAPYVDVPIDIAAPAATATADAATPTVGGNYYIQIVAPAATATADTATAVVSVNAAVTAPAATATATVAVPTQVGVLKVVEPPAVSATIAATALSAVYVGSTMYSTTAAGVYAPAVTALLNKQIDCDSDSWKIALHTSSLTIDSDSNQYWDADPYTSTQVSGTGYTAGGFAAGNLALTYTAATNILKAKPTMTDSTAYWSSASVSFRYIVLYDNTPSSNKPVLAWWDMGTTRTASNQNISVTVGDSVITLTVT